MNTVEVLLFASAARLVLERRGDKIIVKGVTPKTPPELLEALRVNKSDLLAILPSRSAALSSKEPAA